MLRHYVKPGISNVFLEAGFYKVNITTPLASVLIHLIANLNGILPSILNESSCKLQYLRRWKYQFKFHLKLHLFYLPFLFIYLFHILMWPITLKGAQIYFMCFKKYILTLHGNFYCNTCIQHAVKHAYQVTDSKDHPSPKNAQWKIWHLIKWSG